MEAVRRPRERRSRGALSRGPLTAGQRCHRLRRFRRARVRGAGEDRAHGSLDHVAPRVLQVESGSKPPQSACGWPKACRPVPGAVSIGHAPAASGAGACSSSTTTTAFENYATARRRPGARCRGSARRIEGLAKLHSASIRSPRRRHPGLDGFACAGAFCRILWARCAREHRDDARTREPGCTRSKQAPTTSRQAGDETSCACERHRFSAKWRGRAEALSLDLETMCEDGPHAAQGARAHGRLAAHGVSGAARDRRTPAILAEYKDKVTGRPIQRMRVQCRDRRGLGCPRRVEGSSTRAACTRWQDRRS